MVDLDRADEGSGEGISAVKLQITLNIEASEYTEDEAMSFEGFCGVVLVLDWSR